MFLRNLTDEILIYKEEHAPLILEPKSDTYLFIVDEDLIDRITSQFPKKVIKVLIEKIMEAIDEKVEEVVLEEIIVEETIEIIKEEIIEDASEKVEEIIVEETPVKLPKEEKKIVEIVLPKNKTSVVSKNKK